MSDPSRPPELADAPFLGETSNTRYYLHRPGILAAVPHEKAVDTEATARANIAFQRAYWIAQERRGLVAVYVDRLIDQEPGARRVYAAETDPEWFHGIALIGGTMLSRAMASFFVGLSRPRVPVHFVPSMREAERLAERGAS